MYSFFSPPGSPKSPKFRRSALPSTHDHLLHHSHQRSSSLSLASLRSLAQLPENSQQRRRLARSLVFFSSLLVITFVLVSRGVQPVWLRNLQESSEGFSSQVLLRREEHLAQVALQAAGLPIFEGQGSLPTVTSIVTPPSDPLTPAEELAGVVHFLISNHHGVLPPAALLPSYAPSSTPLLAEWVLDFEPGAKGARRNEMMAAFQDEVWTEDAKFIVLGRHKSDEVFFKDMQKFLRDEYLVARSEFVFLDVDGRDDSGVLEHVLQRLLKTSTLPSVLLAGTRVGTFEDLKALHEAGKLKALLQRASVRFEKPKKEKGLKQAVVKRRL